jgi:hypothetical protein
LAVSAGSLWFKARSYEMTEAFCLRVLSTMRLNDYAQRELKQLLQAVWTEGSMRRAGISLLPGQVTVSVSGGEVVVGAAPLDLIVEKVQTIQAMFFRTVEMVKGVAFRVRGPARQDIQDAFRPWIFQAAPGSYQFSIALREPEQPDFFGEAIRPEQIAEKFLDVVRATAAGEDVKLTEVVPDARYRTTFLKLARNLSPTSTGSSFSQIDIRAVGDERLASFGRESRLLINQTIRAEAPDMTLRGERVTITGVLRALHLDKNWLEVVKGGETFRVHELGDAVDDVIGPMVNKPVVVQATRYRSKLKFIDIEIEE